MYFKYFKMKTKNAYKHSYRRLIVAWCHLELNQGRTDFQSVALPTELWHLLQVQNYKFFNKTERYPDLFFNNFINY